MESVLSQILLQPHYSYVEAESQNVFKTCLKTQIKAWIFWLKSLGWELKENEGDGKRPLADVPRSSKTWDSAIYSTFPTFSPSEGLGKSLGKEKWQK